MMVRLPERALLARNRHREPAAERSLDVRPEIIFLHHESDELLGLLLVFGIGKDQSGLDVGAILDRRAVRLVRERGRDDRLLVGLLAGGALLRRERLIVGILETFF